VSRPSDADFAWGTGDLGLVATFRVASIASLRLGAGLWAPLVARPSFEVTGLGIVAKAAPIGGTLRLGVDLRMP
jgi:hypothetical protein